MSGLNQKRILVTDIDSDFGKEIANALIAEGALVFTFVKECRAMQQVLEEYPQLTPILLDVCKEKGEDQARKLILSLPTLDHFVNLSGDTALNIISNCYTNTKIHDVSDTKTKPVVAKMIESGPRPLIFNVSFGNQNIMSKLKANLDPRFQNSKTSQISSNLRQSLKKMFSSNTSSSTTNGESSKQTTTSTTTTMTTSVRTEETVVRETNAATNFAAVAASLNQSQDQASSENTETSSNTGKSTTTATANNSRIQGMQEKNNKIRQGVLKLQKQCAKKWKKAEKRIAKEQKSALKSLHKDIEKTKKIEKANEMKRISDNNASTKTREGALSTETANKILEAREKRAEKEAEKHAQKRLERDTSKILENKETQLSEYHEKLYKKMVEREITEFNRLKSKHLV